MNYGQPYQPPPGFQNPNQNSSTMKYILIGGLVLLFLMALGAGVVFLVNRSDSDESADDDETSESEEKEDEDEADNSENEEKDEDEVGVGPINGSGSNLGSDDFSKILSQANLVCETQSNDTYIDEVVARHYWSRLDVDGLDPAKLLSQSLKDSFSICRFQDDYVTYRLYTISDYQRLQEIAKKIQKTAYPSLSKSECERSTRGAQKDFEEDTLGGSLEVGGRIFESLYAIPQLEEALDAENIDYQKPKFISFCD